MKLTPIPACALALLALLAGCDRRPEGVLSDREMAGLLADIHLSEAYISGNSEQFVTDSARKALRQSILAAHGVTQAQLDSSLAWYGRHIDLYEKLYDRVADNLAARQKKAGQESEAPAEASGFMLPRMVQLSKYGYDIFTFDFPAGNLAKGSLLELKARVVPSSHTMMAETYLAVDYADRTTDYTFSGSFSGGAQGKVSLTLQTDSARTPKRVYGFIRSGAAHSGTVWLDSISLSHTGLNPVSYANESVRSRSFRGAHRAKATPKVTVDSVKAKK